MNLSLSCEAAQVTPKYSALTERRTSFTQRCERSMFAISSKDCKRMVHGELGTPCACTRMRQRCWGKWRAFEAHLIGHDGRMGCIWS
mmetsp:Transcript_4743/g.7272  ORF Transcript_4743/g.7272 Transcript_4743/m.7272 type:complete len:87 (+) Transcript_4743:366-626(+)